MRFRTQGLRSLLPISDHGYVQAPYIEITKERYDELVSAITPIDLSGATHETDDKFCDGDTCVVDFTAN